jgi:glycosyltransferase involved in cell wall biosynthesis
MERKTILHLIDTGGPGGAETVFLDLVCRLDDERWRSVPVIPEEDWLGNALRRRGQEPLLVPTRGSFDVGYLRRLIRLVRQEGVSLIHAHLFSTSVYGSVVGALCRVPVVCTFHGQADAASERFRAAKLQILNRGGGRIVFVSESLRRFFLVLGGLNPGRTQVIYNGIDTEQFAPRPDRSFRDELGMRPDEVLIGAVGNVRASKDYPNFLRAAALLRRRDPRYRFVIVGDSRPSPLMSEVLALRAELGLESAVTFTGFREDVDRVMAALDVFVVSSSAEGFSLTTVQAMAAGLPVVATRCGGPEEILRNGEVGILVPPGSPEALADAIGQVVESPARRERITRAAREEARSRFALESMVSGYEALYERCLGMRPSVRRGAEPLDDRREAMKLQKEASWR